MTSSTVLSLYQHYTLKSHKKEKAKGNNAGNFDRSAEHQTLTNTYTLQRQHLRERKDIKLIEKDILSGIPINQLAQKYNVNTATLYRYKAKHLKKKFIKGKDKRDLKEGDSLIDYLESYMQQVDKIAQACLVELQDPDDPGRLFLGNNALNTVISYLEPDKDGVDRKHKATIQELLDRINKVSTRVEIKGADRVTTLLQASQTMNKHIHLFAELKGMLASVTINVTNQPVFIELTQVVMQALQPYPDAIQAVSQHLRGLKLKDTTVKSKPLIDITPNNSPSDTVQESTEPIIPINQQANS